MRNFLFFIFLPLFYSYQTNVANVANLMPQTARDSVIIEDPTANRGKVEFQWRNDIGNVPFDQPATGEFWVKNISNAPITIVNVQSGCHCTIADFPRDPIAPGATAIVKATYDAKKYGRFYKMLWIYTNLDPQNGVTLALEGNVQ